MRALRQFRHKGQHLGHAVTASDPVHDGRPDDGTIGNSGHGARSDQQRQ